MDIYLIRHGQTSSNVKGEYYGRLDIALNENGIRQMKKLKTELSQIDFDQVYSSDTARTLESLKLCVPDLYQRVQIDQRIREIDFGEFEGKTYEQINRLYPEHMESWHRNWKEFCPPKGERFISFYDRVTSFFEEIIKSNSKNILIMSHSGVIKAIYCYVLKNNLDLYWNFTCKNGKINLIKYEYENLFIDGINKDVL